MSTSKTSKFGRYTIKEHLGEGGMCHVFRAQREGESHDCALKMLKENRRKDEQIRELFITEADLSLLLDHPNLIRTFDAGEVGERLYIAMELIEGGSLGHLLKRAKDAEVPLPQDFVLYIVSEVLEGLHALHTAQGATGRPLGLIHRDISPHNIFLSFDGRVILGDFGVAHIQAYGDSQPEVVLGKIGYLAPEMVLGEEIDQRSDLFAVGVVLHELLTETRLFAEGTDEELMEKIAEVRVPRPKRIRPELTRELELKIMRALARKPKERFDSAESMLYALEPCWSKKLGNPYALSALMAALYKDEVLQWQKRRA